MPLKYRITKPVEITEIAARLSNYGEIENLGVKGISFKPHNPDWPNTLIAPSGKVEIEPGNLFPDEIEDFVDTLSMIVDAEIKPEKE